MSHVPTPAAARLARARWLDTRFVLGVLLVLGSVVLGAKVVAEADDTVAIWGVARDMGPGARLERDDLVRRDVRIDGNGGHYVAADGDPPLDYVLTRAVGGGELLPASAVAARDEASLRRLAVEVDSVSTTGLARDAVVDIYVVPEPGMGADATPRSEAVLTGVTVDEVADRSGGLGASTRTGGVVLLVTPVDAKKVLDAQARGSLRLLQVPMSGRSGEAASR